MSEKQQFKVNDFLNLVEKGHFFEAYKMIESNEENDIVFEALFSMAYDYDNITGYSFCYYVFSRTKDCQWLIKCITILTMANSAIEGAYALALHCARELYDNHHEMEALSWMLLLYSLPEGLLSDKEALDIANEILEREPHNEKAIKVVENIRKKEKQN